MAMPPAAAYTTDWAVVSAKMDNCTIHPVAAPNMTAITSVSRTTRRS